MKSVQCMERVVKTRSRGLQGPGARWHLGMLALAGVLMACADSRTTVCANGVRCPPETICVEPPGYCAPLKDVEPCVGLAENTPCAYRVHDIGICRRGVCELDDCEDNTDCNDANPCTRDTCTGGWCHYEPLTGTRCDDNIFCNGADMCVDGTCSVHGGDPCTKGTTFCDEDADVCAGCLADAECPDTIHGEWSDCTGTDGENVCSLDGVQIRSAVTFTCEDSICEPSEHVEARNCERSTDGLSCDDDGACDGMGNCVSCANVGEACSTGNPCERGEIRCVDGNMQCVTVGVAPAGTVCRPQAGACDEAATCTGSSAVCPPNGFNPAACDAGEYCYEGDSGCYPQPTIEITGSDGEVNGEACLDLGIDHLSCEDNYLVRVTNRGRPWASYLQFARHVSCRGAQWIVSQGQLDGTGTFTDSMLNCARVNDCDNNLGRWEFYVTVDGVPSNLEYFRIYNSHHSCPGIPTDGSLTCSGASSFCPIDGPVSPDDPPDPQPPTCPADPQPPTCPAALNDPISWPEEAL